MAWPSTTILHLFGFGIITNTFRACCSGPAANDNSNALYHIFHLETWPNPTCKCSNLSITTGSSSHNYNNIIATLFKLTNNNLAITFENRLEIKLFKLPHMADQTFRSCRFMIIFENCATFYLFLFFNYELFLDLLITIFK